jgi:hypothetical protein
MKNLYDTEEPLGAFEMELGIKDQVALGQLAFPAARLTKKSGGIPSRGRGSGDKG